MSSTSEASSYIHTWANVSRALDSFSACIFRYYDAITIPLTEKKSSSKATLSLKLLLNLEAVSGSRGSSHNRQRLGKALKVDMLMLVKINKTQI